jgi:hypothetical protein
MPDFGRIAFEASACEPTPGKPPSAAVWRTSHRNGTVSDTVPLGCPKSRMGLGRRLAERYRGKRFEGREPAADGAGAPHSPVRGTFLGRRRNGRHAPAPPEYRGSRRGHNRANVGDTRRGAERRLWGESSPVVARLPRRDNLQPSSISVTPTEEIPQTWPTEGDLRKKSSRLARPGRRHLARPEVGQRRPPVQTPGSAAELTSRGSSDWPTPRPKGRRAGPVAPFLRGRSGRAW